MRWSKAFSKTGLLALMLAVVGSGIFFYERQYCGAEQPARYEPQQLRQVITAIYPGEDQFYVIEFKKL